MSLVLVGQVTSAHGIKGQVRVYPYTDHPGRFLEIEEIFLEGEEFSRKIESASVQKNMALVKISGINDRNEAERIRRTNLYIPSRNRKKLKEDEFFISDLMNLDVLDHVSHQKYGQVVDFIAQSGNDILVVKSIDGTFMIPFVKAFVKDISIEKENIYVELIEGMLP